MCKDSNLLCLILLKLFDTIFDLWIFEQGSYIKIESIPCAYAKMDLKTHKCTVLNILNK